MAKRLLFKRLGLALGAVLAALVLTEGALRVFWPQGRVTDDLRYEAVDDASGPGYRLEPGQWIPGAHGGPVNQAGLRGEELERAPERRVLVLGDSFVFGAGVDVDQALPAQLAERLLGRARPGTEIVNAGTPGYGTARELAWLETFGSELEPDEVVLCVFVGNDFSDNLTSQSPRVVGGKLFAGAVDEAVPDWRLELRSWRSKLHLWRLFERRSLQRAASPEGEAPGGARSATQDAAGLERLLDEFARLEAKRLSVYLPEGSPDSAAARRVALSYDLTGLALEGIARWCEVHGAALRVVEIPDVLAVDPVLRERALAVGDFSELEGVDPRRLDLERPSRSLASWCEELGVPLLDLTEDFRRETRALQAADPTSEGLYLFGDSHWNVRGHALAAERVAAWLVAVDLTSTE